MGIKFSSIILVILGIFIAKISFENFNYAQASSGETPDQVRRTASFK
ncbi:MAG: hypothetical protein KC478_03240 [Bacteriovoracaceae bacterium]|nr:hypothetical protein [Bacteriovoracaceae bacterium]